MKNGEYGGFIATRRYYAAEDNVKIELQEDKSIAAPAMGYHIHSSTPEFAKLPFIGLDIAYITDPVGTYIELTEGYDKY